MGLGLKLLGPRAEGQAPGQGGQRVRGLGSQGRLPRGSQLRAGAYKEVEETASQVGAADRSKGLEAGTSGDGLTGMKIGTRQRRGYAAASLLSTASSPHAAGIQTPALVGAAGHTLPGSAFGGPHRLPPKATKPPHLLPQASPQEEQAEASARSPHGLR